MWRILCYLLGHDMQATVYVREDAPSASGFADVCERCGHVEVA